MNEQSYPTKFEDHEHIPTPYLSAIGKVCVNWGALEAVVDLAIGKLAGLNIYDPRSAILPAHLSWPQKMDTLEALIRALKAVHPHLERFEEIKPLLTRAQKARSRLMHGQWSYQDDKVYKLSITARGKLKFEIDPITLDEIDAAAVDCGDAGLAVVKMILSK